MKKLLLSFFFLSIFPLLAMESKKQQEIESFLEENNPQRAFEELKSFLRTNAIDSWAMGKYAYLLLVYKKDENAAKTYAKNALHIHKGNPDCLHTLAWVHYLNKEYEISLSRFMEITDENIKDFDIQYHWAMSAWKAKKIEIAIRHFKIAKQINPKDPKLTLSMALFFEEISRPKQAIQLYNSLLSHKETDPSLHEFLTDRIAKLLPLYQKIPAKKDFDNFKNPTEEQELNPKISKEKKSSDSTLKKEMKNPFFEDQSEETAPRALSPLSLLQHHELGIEMYKLELKDDAMAQFNTVLNRNPDKELETSAATWLKDCAKLEKKGDDARISGLLKLSHSLFESGLYDQSLHVLKRILLIDPKQPQAMKNLAWLYLHFEMPLEALPLLDKVLKEYPRFQEALILKAHALIKLRRFSQSEEFLRQAGEIDGREFSREYSKNLLDRIKAYEK